MSLYLPLFKVLNDAKVQYVVVGGLATVLHGYARLTADIDLVINLEQHEAEKAIRAILACGLKPRLPVDPMQFTDKATREGWINDKNMLVFSFYQPDNPLMILDVFVREPFPFKEMAQRAVPMVWADRYHLCFNLNARSNSVPKDLRISSARAVDDDET